MNLLHTGAATLAIHHLPPITPRGWAAEHHSEIIPASEFDPALYEGAIVTSAAANPAIDIPSLIEQFNLWRNQANAAAQLEGGDGFLLGYDPLNPVDRLPASEIEATDQCVFWWDRAAGAPPLFEWKDVVLFDVVSDALSVSIFLSEGRAIFLHADIDWHNRLS